MDSGNADKNSYLHVVKIFRLICRLLKMKFLHLLSKVHGYIFNGLGKNEFENCQLEYSMSTFSHSSSLKS